VKPETRNRRLEPTGLAKPVKTRGLKGTGPGLVRQESAGRIFGRVWNHTYPFLQSKPGLLAGYPGPLLTLVDTQFHDGVTYVSCSVSNEKAATTSSMNYYHIATLRLAKMQDQ